MYRSLLAPNGELYVPASQEIATVAVLLLLTEMREPPPSHLTVLGERRFLPAFFQHMKCH